MKRKHRFSLLLTLIGVIGVLMACGESSQAASTVSGSNTSSASSQHFKIGQQVKVGSDYIVTVNSFKTDPGDQFTQPKAGDEFVKVDVTIKNSSGKTQTFSSDLSFTLQDATGQKYDQTILSDTTAPDGDIPNGGLLRGQMAYEVLKAQHHFTLTFDPSLTGDEVAIWDLSI